MLMIGAVTVGKGHSEGFEEMKFSLRDNVQVYMYILILKA